MKKILLATSALVASASFASAEVSLSGYAEMGIVGGTGQETRFHNDIDVKFTLSGETDGGLTFGATIDLDEITNGTNPDANRSSVFISGGFGTVTLGDTDGAFDWAMQEVGDNVASAIADNHTAHAGFSGNGGFDGNNRTAGQTSDQILRYNNTFGSIGVAISAEIDDNGAGAGGLDSTIWGLGLKYDAALGGVDLGIGFGYKDAGASDAIGLSLDAKFGNGFRAILNYTDFSNTVIGSGVGNAIDSHAGLGLGYTSGALSVEFNYGIYSGAVANTDRTGYGLAVNYDLGGGAVVMAGYGHSKVEAGSIAADVDAGSNTWSVGLGLSF